MRKLGYLSTKSLSLVERCVRGINFLAFLACPACKVSVLRTYIKLPGGKSEVRVLCGLLHMEPMLKRCGPTTFTVRAELKKESKSLCGKMEREIKVKALIFSLMLSHFGPLWILACTTCFERYLYLGFSSLIVMCLNVVSLIFILY